MTHTFTNAPGDFLWATGIEDTFVPQARPGQRSLDEYALTQHYELWQSDLDLAAESGVAALRWGLPWYRVQPAPGEWDWAWSDRVLDYMVNVKGLTPILDLMHYGTPNWLDGSFADPCYPDRVAEYAQAVAVRYKHLVQHYTPLNEPTINALMCGRLGQWPPYLSGDAGFVGVLLAVAKGIVLTVQALKAEQPGAVTVQVDALWHDYTRDERLAEWVAASNERQYLGLDLTMGRVNASHRLAAWLLANGVRQGELDWFAANAVSYDVLGLNFYPWAYNEKARRRSGEVYTVPGRKTHGSRLGLVLADAYARYGLPMMVTETSAKDSVAGRARWMDQTLAAVRDLRAQGTPVVGYTWFPLFSMLDWEYRLGQRPAQDYLLHLGLYDAAYDDCGGLRRHPTPLVERYQAHIAEAMPALGAAPAPAAVPAPARRCAPGGERIAETG
jgi:beta-glucosidase/6-phospho-beta-glucosidase/beta-galactosidase